MLVFISMPHHATWKPKHLGIVFWFFTFFRHHIRWKCWFFQVLKGHWKFHYKMHVLLNMLHTDLYFLIAEDNLFQIFKTKISGSLTAVNINLPTLVSLFKQESAENFCNLKSESQSGLSGLMKTHISLSYHGQTTAFVDSYFPLTREKIVFHLWSSKDNNASEIRSWGMEQKFPQVKEDVDVLQSRQKKKLLQTYLDLRLDKNLLPRFVLLLPGQL